MFYRVVEPNRGLPGFVRRGHFRPTLPHARRLRGRPNVLSYQGPAADRNSLQRMPGGPLLRILAEWTARAWRIAMMGIGIACVAGLSVLGACSHGAGPGAAGSSHKANGGETGRTISGGAAV